MKNSPNGASPTAGNDRERDEPAPLSFEQLDRLEGVATRAAYFNEASTSPERREFVSKFGPSTVLRLITLAKRGANTTERPVTNPGNTTEPSSLRNQP